MENTKKVAIIMGSDSDWPTVKAAAAQLKSWDIPFEVRVMSATALRPLRRSLQSARRKTASA